MFENKNILVFGYGLTGQSAIRAMKNYTSNLYVYDEKENEETEDFKIFKGLSEDKIDLIIKSPGINPNNSILLEAKEKGIETISDLEVFYRITKSKNIVAITGTNGKTTTTMIVSEILSKVKNTHCVGNIGSPILDILAEYEEDDFVVVEASSFQLENTVNFRPKVSIITNVTSDHLDWHGSVQNYINAKYKIFKNQKEDDYLILNYNDDNLRKINRDNVFYFDINGGKNFGCFVKDGYICFSVGGKEEKIIPLTDIKIPGNHNVENILASVLASKILGVDNDIIKDTISSFMGVEHRIEFVREFLGVKYYNDSKGTNPDSTTMAIRAFSNKIILIAGGYDKKANYESFLREGKNNIKALVLFGKTARDIEEKAKEFDYKTYIVKDLEEAVNLCRYIANEDEIVLLSPACASWDMYSSYEERGKHFKKLVNELI